jgi:putative signal transducing protein
MTPGLVTVFETGNPIALALAKGALEAEGIPFVIQGEGLQDLIGLGRFPGGFNVAAGPVKIHVDIRDAELARDVLADLENA